MTHSTRSGQGRLPPEVAAKLAKRRGTQALRDLGREMQGPLPKGPEQLDLPISMPLYGRTFRRRLTHEFSKPRNREHEEI